MQRARYSVLQSSAATLPKSSAATAVRTEIASQRSSPSNQRLPWTPHGGQQPHGHCQLPWSRAASSRCLCSSSSPLAAARRVRSAGSTLIRELKEHRTFDCEELFSSGLHRTTRASCVHCPGKEWTDGIAPCASAVLMFLIVPSRPAVLCSH